MRADIESTFDKVVTVMRKIERNRGLNTSGEKIGEADCRIEYTRKLLTDGRGLDASVNQITVYLMNDLCIEAGDSLQLPDDGTKEVILVDNQTLPESEDVYARITL